MTNRYKILCAALLLVSFWLTALPTLAQEEISIEKQTEWSTNTKETDAFYEPRYFSKSRLDALRQKKEFQYDEAKIALEIQKEQARRIERSGSGTGTSTEKDKSTSKPKESSSNTSVPVYGANWGLILLIFGVLVILLLYLLGFKPAALFRKNNRKFEKAAEAIPDAENIHTIRFESELEKAIRLKQYKMAIRLLYLEVLKQLSDKQQIDWQMNKTNWEYVREIRNRELQPGFKQITNSFDYVWYGNFTVDEAVFGLLQEKINIFKHSINQQ